MSVKPMSAKWKAACTFLLAITLIAGYSAYAQSEVQPPPNLASIADFAAMFDDPLKANSHHSLQYPQNLFTSTAADCVMADQILQSQNAQQAARRLLEYAHGQNDKKTPVLSLQLALDLGLCHNPQMRMTWSSIKLESSKIGQARAAYLPQINASIRPQRSITHYSVKSGSATQTNQNTSSNIGVSWRALDFGIRSATLESAYHQLAGAVHSQNETLQKIIIEILQTYYDALTKKSQWLARQEITQLAQQTLASAQRRLKNGVGSQNDVLQAQASLSRSKLEETKAYGEYQKALASLIFMVGLPANTSIDLDNTLEADMQAMLDASFNAQQRIIIEQGLQEWLNQASTTHPSIAAARSRWMSAQAGVQVASAQSLPTIDVGANYYRNGRPTDSASNLKSSETSLAITVNIPIFSGFENTYRIRGAQAQAEMARLEMEAIEQEVMRDIIHTHADAQSAWRNLQDAEIFYTSAMLAKESSQRQFENGVTDITQVIQAQSFLVDAQQQRIEAYAKWQIARMSLIVLSYAW